MYSGINIVRSVLFIVIFFLDGGFFGNYFLVFCFFKGVYELRFFLLCYKNIWDVFVVLNYLKILFLFEELNFKDIIFKIVMLVVLLFG